MRWYRAGPDASATWLANARRWAASDCVREPEALPAGRRAGLGGRFRVRARGRRRFAVVLVSAGAHGDAGALLHRVAGRTHLTLCALTGPGVDPNADLRQDERPAGRSAGGPAPARRSPPDRRREDRQRPSPGAVRALGGQGGASHPRRGAREGGTRPRGRGGGAEGARPAPRHFGALRELFPSCFCFCCGSPEAAFLGASPELLVRRSGSGAATVALAGSTRRSADPAVDAHLGEQLLRSPKDRREHEIVVHRIERGLRRHSVWVEAAPEPDLIKMANIQHLGTPIHAQLVAAALGAGACRTAPSDAGRRRGASRPSPAGDRRAGGPRSGLVRGPRGLDGRYRGRGVLRGDPVRPPARPQGRTCLLATASSPTPIPGPSWPRPR